MKQVAGFPVSTGTRITLTAFVRSQAARSGVVTVEQIGINAVSIKMAPAGSSGPGLCGADSAAPANTVLPRSVQKSGQEQKSDQLAGARAMRGCCTEIRSVRLSEVILRLTRGPCGPREGAVHVLSRDAR